MGVDSNIKKSDASVVSDVLKKKPNGMLYGLILAIILALGGVGFGVWAMMDGNNRVEAAKKECTSTNCGIPDDIGRTNPVIKDSDSTIDVSVWFESSGVQANGEDYNRLQVSIKKGSIDTCRYGSYNNGEWYSFQDCDIAVSGDIYKVIEFGSGQDNTNNYIGFLMTDGTINYFPLQAALQDKDFSIKGQIAYDKKIVDVVGASAFTGDYVLMSSMFVLEDGTVKMFDKDIDIE